MYSNTTYKQVLYVIEVIKTLQMNIEERMNGGITY